ncbi:fibronectin type III domain-containing protein [Algibacter sp. Ld11]|uniref:fibronectin type III domain-containing protein n=1 Tax=Algibacter sp. Ld11 TaxID=649150 RepID=UPI00386806DB
MIKVKFIIKILIIVCTVSFYGCSGGDGGGDDDGGKAPEKATLVFPLNNSECNEGDIISETQTKVTFEWNASANTNKYTIVLKNLVDNTTRNINTTNTSQSENLLRGVPYSWSVISKSNSNTTTATSDTWKFYNAGLGVENYAPFPAELVAPNMGGLTSTTTTLEWNGSDIDNDIESYDVYLGTSNSPTTLLESISSTSSSASGLTANTVYYWKVVTTDTHGNNSESPVFEFRTQ